MVGIKAVGKVSQLVEATRQDAHGLLVAASTSGIAHTRWATHGAPTQANAHPHFDQSHKIALVHNGIIENYRNLRQKLMARGHTFTSDTDTEVLARLIGDDYQGDLRLAVASALRQVEGAYGIAVMSADHPGEIIVACKGSPLVVGMGEHGCLVASDTAALVTHTQQVIYLDDGDLAKITATSIDITDLNQTPLDRTLKTLEQDAGAIEKGGYEHFMLKEIFDQLEAITNTLRGRLDITHGKAVLAGMGTSSRDLAEIRRIVMVGCGTSLHAAMVGEFAFEELAHLHAEVQQAAEFRYCNPLIDANDLVIAISQSGETADTLAAVREAKDKGALVLGLVNVVGSTIARETGRGVYLHAGPEISVASTKGFTTQVTALLLMALKLARGRRMSQERGHALAQGLAQLPELIRRVLDQNDAIAEVAQHLVGQEHIFYLGRGPFHPVALEGALKLKEISYLHAEGYHAAELKHGPIALLAPGTPVVVLAPQSPVRDKVWSNAEECRARGAKIIAVITEGSEAPGASAVITIPACEPLLATIPATIALQLLAYHVARLQGCPIDQPRNLAKSVTVE
jgi:glucosamine--fructose-6-phosphate aminotransferase (isomerizing)